MEIILEMVQGGGENEEERKRRQGMKKQIHWEKGCQVGPRRRVLSPSRPTCNSSQIQIYNVYPHVHRFCCTLASQLARRHYRYRDSQKNVATLDIFSSILLLDPSDQPLGFARDGFAPHFRVGAEEAPPWLHEQENKHASYMYQQYRQQAYACKVRAWTILEFSRISHRVRKGRDGGFSTVDQCQSKKAHDQQEEIFLIVPQFNRNQIPSNQYNCSTKKELYRI